METMEESLQFARRVNEDIKARIESNSIRAKALESISETKQAALCRMLVEIGKKDRSRYHNFIKALVYYIKQHSK